METTDPSEDQLPETGGSAVFEESGAGPMCVCTRTGPTGWVYTRKQAGLGVRGVGRWGARRFDLEALAACGNKPAAETDAVSGSEAAAGTAEAIYNTVTGELLFDIGAGVSVVGIESIGNVLPANIDNASLFGTPAQLNTDTIAFFNAAGLPLGEDSVGMVLVPGLTQADLGFSYTPIGGPSTIIDVTIIPEPGSLALLGLGGLLMLRRSSAQVARRRR